MTVSQPLAIVALCQAISANPQPPLAYLRLHPLASFAVCLYYHYGLQATQLLLSTYSPLEITILEDENKHGNVEEWTVPRSLTITSEWIRIGHWSSESLTQVPTAHVVAFWKALLMSLSDILDLSAVETIIGFIGSLGRWKVGQESAESSCMKTERWEAENKGLAWHRIDSQAIVTKHLRTFGRVTAKAGVKMQAIHAS
ncbi:hypothetical protein BKA83DRAFT_4130481 [Pisolithus microcarpus]|nr:hypothetical protein BKA83DRAFT_4130481 [Pisolithus microcarpus]